MIEHQVTSKQTDLVRAKTALVVDYYRCEFPDQDTKVRTGRNILYSGYSVVFFEEILRNRKGFLKVPKFSWVMFQWNSALDSNRRQRHSPGSREHL